MENTSESNNSNNRELRSSKCKNMPSGRDDDATTAKAKNGFMSNIIVTS